MKMVVKLTPVGMVRSSITEPTYEDWQSVTSQIIVEPDLLPALDRLNDFSHIIVVWWAHRIKTSERTRLKAHPMHDLSSPPVGVFATRSPKRPNPVGISIVKLKEVRGNVLMVSGLDAVDGTPVLDLKPYLPDEIQGEVSVPGWLHEARERKRREKRGLIKQPPEARP